MSARFEIVQKFFPSSSPLSPISGNKTSCFICLPIRSIFQAPFNQPCCSIWLTSSNMIGKLANSVKGSRVVYFTIKNLEAAKRVADHLIKTPNDSIILPFIDHPGPTSEEILKRKFGFLTICERNKSIRESFEVSSLLISIHI